MKIVLFANQTGESLRPLTDRTCVSLLPVAAKPLLHHTVESLAAAGFREATVVVGVHAGDVEASLGDGRRWGLTLSYVLARPEEPMEVTIARIRAGKKGDMLVVRGDMLRSPFLGRFVERAQCHANAVVAATVGGQNAGVWLIRARASRPVSLPTTDVAAPARAVEMEGAGLVAVDSLAAYHRANMEAAAGAVPGLMLAGRTSVPRALVGRRSRLEESSIRAERVCLGSGCWVERRAELRGRVVLSDNVVVDEWATLENTVVLPNTYVGRTVALRNSIVWGDQLIRVDTGASVRVSDDFLIGDLRTSRIGERLGSAVHRLAGLLLLVLSAPLWLAALAASLRVRPSRPFRTVRLVGNRRRAAAESMVPEQVTFTAFEAATGVPVLRHLPKLLAVVAGHLQLVGVRPRPADQSRPAENEWESLSATAPAGLFSPADLLASAGAPEEEKRLLESHYACTRSWKADLYLAARAFLRLFRLQSWRSSDGASRVRGARAALGAVAEAG